MNNLQNAWIVLLGSGIILLGIDIVFLPLFNIRGIPAISIIGAALILLVFTSALNWIFKTAWAEYSESDSKDN